MRRNPLINEVLAGLTRGGKAQLDYVGLLLLQAVALFLWWPKSGVAQMLERQQSPRTLTAMVMVVGLTTAYFALRAGAEEIMLPGQHRLRDWARTASLRPGRILNGYVLGQLLHSLYLLALSAPLLLMAFTISGGDWAALGGCLAAVLAQALFYRLCGAITQLTVGHHAGVSFYTVRAILLLVYVPVGLFAPATSHLALTYRALGEDATQPRIAGMPDHVAFLVIYAILSVLAAFAVHRRLLHERARMKHSHDSVGKVLTE